MVTIPSALVVAIGETFPLLSMTIMTMTRCPRIRTLPRLYKLAEAGLGSLVKTGHIYTNRFQVYDR
jgi:hypothetical protein